MGSKEREEQMIDKPLHTEGPWTHHDVSWENDRTKFSIIRNGPLAYVGDNTNGPDNCEANALLMSKAPELLAALQAMIGFCTFHGIQPNKILDNAIKVVESSIFKIK
jgi:hypothetical protein